MTLLRYSMDEKMPWGQRLLYSVQWLATAVPMIVIVSQVAALLHYPNDLAQQMQYIQRLFFMTGAVWLVQLLWGHKLPVIAGPATVLLLGVLANTTGARNDMTAIYFTVALCGLLMTLLSMCNLTTVLPAVFTPRITGVVLLLIAFTLLPTVLKLITEIPNFSLQHIMFAGALLLLVLAGQQLLPGVLRRTVIIWAFLIGSGVYYLLFGCPVATVMPDCAFISLAWLTVAPAVSVSWSVLLSLLFCYGALIANDIGSVQATGALVKADAVAQRSKRGLIVTGFGNVLGGLLGVIGPVNYSLAAGVIISSGCASRYSMMPAAAAMIVLACLPAVIQAFLYIPSLVIGVLLLYMLSGQVAGGLSMLAPYLEASQHETALIVGLPILIATCIAFLPPAAVSSIPLLIKPLLSNGFVVGVVIAVCLEKSIG